MYRTVMIAIGGNALIHPSEGGDRVRQVARAARAARLIAPLIRQGLRVMITHGNGPQVGAALERSERSAGEVYELPLDVCVAATQGEIGYQLQQSLQNELRRAGAAVHVMTVLTQAVVDAGDPAFSRPDKPIGPVHSRPRPTGKSQGQKWAAAKEPLGYRRVVPSPAPLDIVEAEGILALWKGGAVIIAAGGGGIPVVRECGRLVGIEAVIDKDLTSALLATMLGIELLVFVTDSGGVYVDYGLPRQRLLHRVSSLEIERQLSTGQFPHGSMRPKIEAALGFLRAGGREVIVTSLDRLDAAVWDGAGTHILPHPDGEERAQDDPAPAGEELSGCWSRR